MMVARSVMLVSVLATCVWSCTGQRSTTPGPESAQIDSEAWSGALPPTRVHFEPGGSISVDLAVLGRQRDDVFLDLVERGVPRVNEELVYRLEPLLRSVASGPADTSDTFAGVLAATADPTERAFVESIVALITEPETTPEWLTAEPVRRDWPAAPFRIPFGTAVTGTPVVSAVIGDCVVRLWLDTGASGSVLSDSVAERCGVEAYEPPDVSTAGASQREFEEAPAVVPSISIGPALLHDERVAIIPTDALVIGGEAIDGILGWPVLRERRIEMDFETNCMSVGPPHAPSPQAELFWLGYPLVVFAAEGRPAVFGLDTGAGSTRLSETGLELTTGQRWATEFAVGGVGGTRDVQSAMAERLQVSTQTGTLTVTHPKTARGSFGSLVPVHGRLGMDVLRSAGHVIVDYVAGEFELGPGPGLTCDCP